MKIRYAVAAIAAPALAGCATVQQEPAGNAALDRALAAQLAGQSQIQGGQLEQALAEAAQYPLGSDRNPVRAEGPAGQRAYLDRLRCPNGDAPEYFRTGNLGPGVFQNIVDAYSVTCSGKDSVTVVMDMYHRGYVEKEAVSGFTINGRLGQPQ